MVYFMVLSVVVAFLGYADPKYGLQKDNGKKYLLICGFLIAVVMGLRSPYVGSADTLAYTNYFRRLATFENFKDYYDERFAEYNIIVSETGFYYFVWLLTRVFSDSQMIVFVTSVYITWTTCYFIHKNSSNVGLSLLIYVCWGLMTFNMNGMRQAMAMSTCLLAYEQAKKRKLIRFTLLILLAMQSHKTALCFFPVYFLINMKNTPFNWLFYMTCLVMGVLSTEWLITSYNAFSQEEYQTLAAVSGGGLFVILLYLGGIVLTMIHPQSLERQSTRIAMYGTITGLASYITRYFANQIMERISYYYFYFLILLIPDAINELRTEDKKFVKMIFIAGSIFILLYRSRDYGFHLFFT